MINLKYTQTRTHKMPLQPKTPQLLLTLASILLSLSLSLPYTDATSVQYENNIEIGPKFTIIGKYGQINPSDYPNALEVWQVNDNDDAHDIIWQAFANSAYYGGGTIHIKAGTYTLSRPINLDFISIPTETDKGIKKLHIQGEGAGKTI